MVTRCSKDSTVLIRFLGRFSEGTIGGGKHPCDPNCRNQLSIEYSGNSTNCAPYSAVEVRLGGVDGTLIGTILVPPTASGCGPYKIATGQLTEALIGVHDVYFVLTGSTDSNYKYIGNFDRAEFTRL
ncbi:carbohydrate-binding protein [Paenibacillus lautus]|uniref:carbohydrate-binding protein n=1 Tax=Paenibacillus lautus TaxID=1401 RepID=UPI003D29C4D7